MKVMVSGGFDPLHTGHLNLLEGARFYGDDLVVVLNSDDWLVRKKGYVFMPFSDRARILKSIGIVSDVISVDDHDGTVCEAILRVRPAAFCNGGDREEAHPKEDELCRELGIFQIFYVGGPKVQSSSLLVSGVRT